MSDTANVTSEEKLCDCGAVFGPEDDKRYGKCKGCREGGAVTEPAVAAPPALTVEPVRLKEEDLVPPIPEQTRRMYWCGVTEDSPKSCVHLGGFDFPLDRGLISGKGAEKMMADHAVAGAEHMLTDAEVELIMERCANRVVRGRGKRRNVLSRITSKKARPYTAHVDDEPLGKYVYLIPGPRRSDLDVEKYTMVPR